jgi:hypothetical protein
MYEIEVTVTTSIPTELRLTGNWPRVWLQGPGSVEIRKGFGRQIPGSSKLDRRPTAVTKSPKGNTFINFGGVYPNQTFTGSRTWSNWPRRREIACLL